MKVLVCGSEEVVKLLPMSECIDVLEEMFRTLSRGEALLPLRQVLKLPNGKGAFALMPSYLGGEVSSVGTKIITVFPGNLATAYESHQGCVLLFECENGKLLAILDASSVTAIRTAAASAVATKLLARADASTLAILGSGTQASTHLEAMQSVRNIKRIIIWSRNKDHAKAFVKDHEGKTAAALELFDSPREAIRDADIICTTTAASDPIVEGKWLNQGAHINAVGASRPLSRELDSYAVARSRVYTDRKESLLNEADDFLVPRREGRIGDDHLVGDLGDLLLGKISGRRNKAEITLFKSLGIATEDVASAFHIYRKALEKGKGTWVEFSPERSEKYFQS